MGTNYYARIIPSKKRKLELCDAINTDNFDKILKEINETFGSFSIDYDGKPIGGEIHLGKRSGGWKFLWNPNIYIIHNGHSEWIDNGDGSKSHKWVNEPDTYHYIYPLTKEGIWSFINRPDVKIFNEYNEEQDKKEFFDMALNWTTWTDWETGKEKEAWDGDSYEEYERSKNSNWRNCYIPSGEFINALEHLGYKLGKYKTDFYSDGLRFAISTEFS